MPICSMVFLVLIMYIQLFIFVILNATVAPWWYAIASICLLPVFLVRGGYTGPTNLRIGVLVHDVADSQVGHGDSFGGRCSKVYLDML